MAKNVNIIPYDTNTKNISFIAGLDRTANRTATIQHENVIDTNKLCVKKVYSQNCGIEAYL